LAEIAVAPESAATQEAERWLGAFEAALANRDAAAAAALFATDSYWRDLVAFTFVNKSDFSGRALLALVGPRSEPTRPESRANSSTQAACRTQKVARFEFGDESLSQPRAATKRYRSRIGVQTPPPL